MSEPYAGQIRRGIGTLGNGDLWVIVLDDEYVPVFEHDTVADIVAHEVSGAGYERAIITATVELIEGTWYALPDSVPVIDLTGIDNRGFVVIARSAGSDAAAELCTWSADPGPATSTYEPTWTDGILTDGILTLDEALINEALATITGIDGGTP